MGSSFVISPQVVHSLSRPRTVKPSRLQKAAQMAHRIAYRVETGWADLPEEARINLKNLAYDLIEPARGFRGALSKLLGQMSLAIIALTGQTDALYEYLVASKRLVNAILGAIEQESSIYKQTLEGAIKEGITGSERASTVRSEHVRDWLSSISDQAHQ